MGAYAIRPYTGTCKTWRVLGLNLRRETFWGVCNTPLHGYMQNLAGFIFPNRDRPKSHPVLEPNLRRGTFRGVCNTPLHGYVQNLASFRRKSSAQDILGRMQYAPTRIRQKPARFLAQTFGEGHFGAYAFAPYMGTCKNCPVSQFRTRIHPKRTPFHPSQ